MERIYSSEVVNEAPVAGEMCSGCIDHLYHQILEAEQIPWELRHYYHRNSIFRYYEVNGPEEYAEMLADRWQYEDFCELVSFRAAPSGIVIKLSTATSTCSETYKFCVVSGAGNTGSASGVNDD